MQCPHMRLSHALRRFHFKNVTTRIDYVEVIFDWYMMRWYVGTEYMHEHQ